jgi:hypothetical protein
LDPRSQHIKGPQCPFKGKLKVSKYDIYNIHIDKRVFMSDASANQRDTASVIKDMIAFRDSRDYSIFSLREINEMVQQ